MQGNIVLVWVGGTGVSALAGLFQELGYTNLVGIDSTESELTEQLQSRGVNVIIGHGQYQVQPHDKVIYSAAVQESPEVVEAKKIALDNPKRIFPPLLYAEFLGEISKYMCTVAVTGTHGKSTTTGLTATALHDHHSKFGIGIVGANITQRNNRNFITKPETVPYTKKIIDHIFDPKAEGVEELMKQYLFVVEADEYNRHFLNLDPDYALVTNIELDHADYYGTEAAYFEAYERFASKVKHTIWMLQGAQGVSVISQFPTVIHPHLKNFTFASLLGSHNHGNASLALACVSELLAQDPALTEDESFASVQKEIDQATETLNNFQWLRRRGELLTTNKNGAPIISDYGHHPTELASTLLAIREKYSEKKITCIFQPHQARRVMEFWDEFVKALKTVDQLIIYDIYAARESLEELKQRFWAFWHIWTIMDLGELFATTAGGIYTIDFNHITNILTNAQHDEVVVIFTAGNLDFKIRNFLK